MSQDLQAPPETLEQQAHRLRVQQVLLDQQALRAQAQLDRLAAAQQALQAQAAQVRLALQAQTEAQALLGLPDTQDPV